MNCPDCSIPWDPELEPKCPGCQLDVDDLTAAEEMMERLERAREEGGL